MMTLCWGCGNAVPDAEGERGCPWSREGKPVEAGWLSAGTSWSRPQVRAARRSGLRATRLLYARRLCRDRGGERK